MDTTTQTETVPTTTTTDPVEESTHHSVNFRSFIGNYFKQANLSASPSAIGEIDKTLVDMMDEISREAKDLMKGRQTMKGSDVELASRIVLGKKKTSGFKELMGQTMNKLSENRPGNFQGRSGLPLPNSRVNILLKKHVSRASKESSIALTVLASMRLKALRDGISSTVEPNGDRPARVKVEDVERVVASV